MHGFCKKPLSIIVGGKAPTTLSAHWRVCIQLWRVFLSYHLLTTLWVKSSLLVVWYENKLLLIAERSQIRLNFFQTNELFERELSSMNVTKPFSRFAPETYDAVWSIALALKGAEETWRNESRVGKKRKRKKLDFFDYTRKDLAEDFLEQFGRLKFQGISVSKRKTKRKRSESCWKHFFSFFFSCFFFFSFQQGNVSFDGADRVGITAFYQIQFAILQPVALYYPETEFLDFSCPNCMTIKWQNNVVPIAKRIFKLRFATISKLAFFTVTSLAVVGIILSILFLAFNLHFRKLK